MFANLGGYVGMPAGEYRSGPAMSRPCTAMSMDTLVAAQVTTTCQRPSMLTHLVHAARLSVAVYLLGLQHRIVIPFVFEAAVARSVRIFLKQDRPNT